MRKLKIFLITFLTALLLPLFVSAAPCFPIVGCTGTSTIPQEDDVLVGNGSGIYKVVPFETFLEPFISGLVPYTGATNNVDVGTYSVSADAFGYGGSPIIGASDSTLLGNKALALAEWAGNYLRLIKWGESFGLSLNLDSLTQERTAAFQDKDGTVAYLDDIPAPSTNYWTLSSNSLYPTSTSYAVGIGTTDITSLLNVYGNAKIGKSVTSTAVKTFDVAGNLNYDQVADPTSAQHRGMTFATSGTTGLSPGSYYYNVVFYTSEGDTSSYAGGTSYASTTLLTTSSVVISNIPTSSDPRVIGRKLYRSTSTDGVNQQYFQYLFATITNNTDTTYTDTGAALTTSDYAYWKANTTAGVAYIDGVKLYSASEYNTTFGTGVLGKLTRGNGNAGFGSYALRDITTGVNNTGFGHYAAYSVTTGRGNVALGYSALQGVTSGSSNIGVGSNALRNNNAYDYTGNVAVGDAALGILNASNNYNTAMGYYAGTRNQGSYNIFLGGYAGNLATATTTGNYNIVLGYEAGRSMGKGGDKNVLIGYQVELLASTTDSQLNIGNVLYGTGLGVGSSPSATGKIGIGTTTPQEVLDVVGSLRLGATNNTANRGIKFYTDTGTLVGSITRTDSIVTSTLADLTISGYSGIGFKSNGGGVLPTSYNMYLDINGNLGIGTSTPSYDLQIAKTTLSTLAIGNSTLTGCIVMGDDDSGGITYVTARDGVLSATTTKPSICR